MKCTLCAAFVTLSVLSFTLAGPRAAAAQGYQGGIRGDVKDAGGAVPAADVTLTNEGTSVSRSTQTNQAGEYTFPNLAPGSYALKDALQGYRSPSLSRLPRGTHPIPPRA